MRTSVLMRTPGLGSPQPLAPSNNHHTNLSPLNVNDSTLLLPHHQNGYPSILVPNPLQSSLQNPETNTKTNPFNKIINPSSSLPFTSSIQRNPPSRSPWRNINRVIYPPTSTIGDSSPGFFNRSCGTRSRGMG